MKKIIFFTMLVIAATIRPSQERVRENVPSWRERLHRRLGFDTPEQSYWKVRRRRTYRPVSRFYYPTYAPYDWYSRASLRDEWDKREKSNELRKQLKLREQEEKEKGRAES